MNDNSILAEAFDVCKVFTGPEARNNLSRFLPHLWKEKSLNNSYMETLRGVEMDFSKLFEVSIVGPGMVVREYIVAFDEDAVYMELGRRGVERKAVIDVRHMTDDPETIAIFQA